MFNNSARIHRRHRTSPEVGYGALYNLYAAKTIGIAGKGWEVPTVDKINTLLLAADNTAATYDAGESIVPVWGDEIGNILSLAGLNAFNFNIKNGGNRTFNGTFASMGETFFMWTSDVADGFQDETVPYYDWGWYFQCYYPDGGNDGGVSVGDVRAVNGLSIYLVKSTPTPEELLLPDGSPATPYVDYDSNTYQTVKIGTQVWMAEPLKVVHYSDGSLIVEVTNSEDWASLKTGAYCWYDNDIANK